MCASSEAMIRWCRLGVFQLIFTRPALLLIPVIIRAAGSVESSSASFVIDTVFRSLGFGFLFWAMLALLWFYRSLAPAGLLELTPPSTLSSSRPDPPLRVILTFLWIKSLVWCEVGQNALLKQLDRMGALAHMGCDTSQLEALLLLAECALVTVWSWHLFWPLRYAAAPPPQSDRKHLRSSPFADEASSELPRPSPSPSPSPRAATRPRWVSRQNPWRALVWVLAVWRGSWKQPSAEDTREHLLAERDQTPTPTPDGGGWVEQATAEGSINSHDPV
ncbi:hypothetical protein PAPYR_2998 [Paratrimastix pyriformis]|uniref:Uncharacterized protein n=1 Tax=Paratrimastix pyriformis TaxID=342808 RepID=A0ABQ8UT87_9EUKA|nr:hypothetical protein PAPYR_2998 [Paratrimastix pyriformis]